MAHRTVASQLGLNVDLIRLGLEQLKKSRLVRRKRKTERLPPQAVEEGERLFLTQLYDAEKEIARHIRRLQSVEHAELTIPAGAFGLHPTTGAPLIPDESQQQALELAARSAVIVMTGGPGVGKTTVAKAMLALYDAAGLSVTCCAPTGKAAIRITQQTGAVAKTIHQTIGMVPGQPPKHHAAAPLDTKVVVVDESSMIDVELFESMVAATPTGARLLIIGDVDQLPSIGAGRVLFDIIASGTVPVVRLTKIHRQASESRIPYVARDINEGRAPDLDVKGSDFSHWETPDAWMVAERVLGAVCSEIPRLRSIGIDDIQVMAAQYDDDKNSLIGVSGLNRLLQSKLNPSASSADDVFIGRSYSVRVKDRVIQTRNNYDLNIRNGEIGRVLAADPKGLPLDMSCHWSDKIIKPSAAEEDEGEEAQNEDAERAQPVGGVKTITVDGERIQVWSSSRVLIVDFGTPEAPNKIAFTKTEAKELELGYCITVHKSQGSQFKAVVLVVHEQHHYMLTRALVYTGITRAEKFCLTIGQGEQLARSARNTRGTERRTMLQQRLNAATFSTELVRVDLGTVRPPVAQPAPAPEEQMALGVDDPLPIL